MENTFIFENLDLKNSFDFRSCAREVTPISCPAFLVLWSFFAAHWLPSRWVSWPTRRVDQSSFARSVHSSSSAPWSRSPTSCACRIRGSPLHLGKTLFLLFTEEKNVEGVVRSHCTYLKRQLGHLIEM